MLYYRERLTYAAGFLLLLAAEVVIALFVHDRLIRPYGGDVLVVILLYCLIRAICPRGIRPLPLYLFLFASLVELLQYFHFVSWLGLAGNRLAEALLGISFSFWDILCYLVGCSVCALIDGIRYRKRER